MKKYSLIYVSVTCAFILFTVACNNPVKSKLKGYWRSKDGSVKLSITDKSFTMDDGESIAEDYFIKNDTVCTSFEGNEPYTKFVVQKVDEHYLKLIGPDSVAVEYNR